MPCWDGGAAQQPEEEREQQDAWQDPPDSAAEEWKGGEPANQGDEWKRDWGTGPEHTLNWDGWYGSEGA